MMTNTYSLGNNLLVDANSMLEQYLLLTLEQALLGAQEQLQAFASDSEFGQKIELAFGSGASAEELRKAWLAGDFSQLPRIEIRSATEINGARGAFAGVNNTIYLSQELIVENSNNVNAVIDVLLEEIGHFVDWQINVSDTPGDEGAIFSALVQCKVLDEAELKVLRAEDDTTTIFLNGQIIGIEQAFSTEDMMVSGGRGSEFLAAGFGKDTIFGGGGDDTLFGNDNDDILYGEGDNDYLYGGWQGKDTLYGGEGNDYLYSDGYFYNHVYNDVSGDNDYLYGENGNDTLEAYGGNDYLSGDGDDDYLDGGEGDDTLNGGEGDDSLDGGNGNDTLDGGDGNDTLLCGSNANGLNEDILKGGADNDTYIIDISSSSSSLKAQIEDVKGSGDSLIIRESIYDVSEIKLSKILEKGSVGVLQEDTSLIVDLNKDGVANRADDLEIVDFYKRNVDKNGFVFYTHGSGYIEKMNFADGSDLDPLQVKGNFQVNTTTKRYEASGEIQIGLKGEPFEPLVNLQGSMSYDKRTIKAKGTIAPSIGGVTVPLLSGEFTINVGEATTFSLSDKNPPEQNKGQNSTDEFKLGGLENSFTQLSFAEDQIELQGVIKLPASLGNALVGITGDNKLIINSTNGVSLTGANISLPKVDFRLAGVPIKAENLSLQYFNKPQELFKLQGQVSLSSLSKITTDISANFADPNYIQLDANGKLDAVGSLEIGQIGLGGSWSINDVKLNFDTVNNNVSGAGTLILPTGIDVNGEIAFLNGELNTFSLRAPNLNKPIGTTGAYLRSIGGKVDHIGKSDPNPILFSGNAGVTAGPEIDVSLPSWAGGGSFSGSLVKLNVGGSINEQRLKGNGNIAIAGGLITGTGNAELNWTNNFLNGSVTFSALAGLITANAGFTTNSNLDLKMLAKASVKLPDVAPFSTFGLSGEEVASGSFLLEYRNDGSSANDFIMSWGTVLGGTAGVRVGFDNKWELIGAERINSIKAPIEGQGSIFPGFNFDNSNIPLLDNFTLHQTVAQALQIAQNKLRNFATAPDFSSKMNIAFGNTWDTKQAELLTQAWSVGDFSALPPIEIYPRNIISNANAAFADATKTVYISQEYLSQNANNLDAVANVLLEEIGHSVDAQVNVLDSPGDEGAIFSALVNGETITNSQLEQLKAEDDAILINLNGKDTQLNLNSSQEDTFRVGAGKPWLAIAVNWENSASNVPIQLQAPDGTVYTEADIANNDQIDILSDLSTSTRKVIRIANPTAGDWTIKLTDTANLGNVKFAALGGTNAPTIKITGLTQDIANEKVTINYKAFDVDSDAKISFFYDTDNEGFDGILLADNLIENDGAGSYVWNTKDIPIDNYYIYAIAMDENSAPAFAYSPGSVQDGNTNPPSSNGGSNTSLPPITRLPEFNGIFFDPTFYLGRNPDVAAAIQSGAFRTAFEHFSKFGFTEGRSPSAVFASDYLTKNQDVAAAVTQGFFKSGFEHFIKHGMAEGREPTSGLAPFDMFYQAENPDVAQAVNQGFFKNGLEHLIHFGMLEGRDPMPRYSVLAETFDPTFYSANNSDFAEAVQKGFFRHSFEHFIKHGMKESRNPSLLFNNNFYLTQNSDVAAAVSQDFFKSGFEHFMKFGMAEGRVGATIVGSASADRLEGNAGANIIDGSAGNDTIVGGIGNDLLIGGTGNDLFVLGSGTGVDAIADFQVGQDRLGLSGGLKFEQLMIAQGTGTSVQDTFVRIAANDELLAVLSNVPASSITNSAFTLV